MILGRESVPSKAHGDKGKVDSAGRRCFIGITYCVLSSHYGKGQSSPSESAFPPAALFPKEKAPKRKAVSEPPSPGVSHELT